MSQAFYVGKTYAFLVEKRGVIGVDIDEVLAEYVAGFLAFHNKKYGTKMTVDKVESYSFHKILQVSKEEILRRMNEFHATDEFKQIMPVPGAKKAIEKLPHELIAITARSNNIEAHTKNWLDVHFSGRISEVHFARNVHIGEKTNRSKADFCREADVQLLIEDSLENAKECAMAGIKVFLLDRPWNQGELPLNVTRVKSWDEIVALIKTI